MERYHWPFMLAVGIQSASDHVLGGAPGWEVPPWLGTWITTGTAIAILVERLLGLWKMVKPPPPPIVPSATPPLELFRGNRPRSGWIGGTFLLLGGMVAFSAQIAGVIASLTSLTRAWEAGVHAPAATDFQALYWTLAGGLAFLFIGRVALRRLIMDRFRKLYLALSIVVALVSIWLLVPLLRTAVESLRT